jgi:hypothetical protein
MLEHLNFSVFKIIITLKQTTYFTFKQRFELVKHLLRVMKRSFPCKQKDNCLKCKYLEKDEKICDYPFLAGILSKSDTRSVSAKPFILMPPLNQREIFAEEEDMEFLLTLIGPAADFYYLSKYFAPTFDSMGKFSGLGSGRTSQRDLYLGRYDLKEIQALNDSDEFEKIFDQGSGFISKEYKRCNITNLPEFNINSSINIGWNTPFSSNKKLPLSFPEFWTVVYHRLQPLNYLYGKIEDGDVSEWNDLRNKSKNIILKPQGEMFNSMFPVMIYEGDTQDFIPYLILGAYLHIGQNTGYGYGNYYII